MLQEEWDLKPEEEKQKERDICPNCGRGGHGKDPLCLICWMDYLGTHVGGR